MPTMIFKQDLRRYLTRRSQWNVWGMALAFFYQEEIWTIATFRFGQWVRAKVSIPIIRQALIILSSLIHRIAELVTGIHISFDSKIGPGFYIGHAGRIILAPHVEIGESCNLSTGNVLGTIWKGEKAGSPKIGNRVYIGIDAKVFGNVTVGDEAVILANSVVLSDVPQKARVGGCPAKVIDFSGSGDYIQDYKDED